VPEVERKLMQLRRPILGFYALNGTSVAVFTETQTKERICHAFERIRAENPDRDILLVLDNFSSHTCEYTRSRADELGIDLVFLPVGSPDLNPIEPLWKSLKWSISPIAVSSTAEFCTLVRDVFQQLTEKLSFADDWIERFLDIQKLS
jgi:transposase